MVKRIITCITCIGVLSILLFSCKTESSIPKTDNTVDTNNLSSQVIAGKLNGLFSVSKTKKVQFSQGNLQYQASTNTWRFAENQWDFCGKNNENISPTYDDWIDLFGWGTGDNPTKHSKNNNDYRSYTDWGESLLSNSANIWHNLTIEEWEYVFDRRNTDSGIRFVKAVVNNVNGIILFPDDWEVNMYELTNINNSSSSFLSNNISKNDWIGSFETNGAVFLPAAGYREYDITSFINVSGEYWSSSCHDYRDNSIYRVFFNNAYLNTCYFHFACTGLSVRLVSDAE